MHQKEWPAKQDKKEIWVYEGKGGIGYRKNLDGTGFLLEAIRVIN